MKKFIICSLIITTFCLAAIQVPARSITITIANCCGSHHNPKIGFNVYKAAAKKYTKLGIDTRQNFSLREPVADEGKEPKGNQVKCIQIMQKLGKHYKKVENYYYYSTSEKALMKNGDIFVCHDGKVKRCTRRPSYPASSSTLGKNVNSIRSI